MKTYLFVFPSFVRGKHYIEENILPFNKFKKVREDLYEIEDFRLYVLSTNHPENLRGFKAEMVYMHEDCSKEVYEIMLSNVQGTHGRIKVVI